ncbi:hypothetical protein LCGC14_1920940 [marine sediment metagenome]|uniref:Uncharacterized protein n=1 Tax=marine sediment metagenome TaxID=412755 RepID=A0A0F9FQN2_9ZZZZ
MPQSKEVHRKYMEDRRKVHETDAKGSQNGVKGSQSAEVHNKGSQEYPGNMKPLLIALGDIKQRGKLRAIYESLGRRDLTTHVHYGIHGVTFDVVGELLEAF